jgi:hypothetical protein
LEQAVLAESLFQLTATTAKTALMVRSVHSEHTVRHLVEKQEQALASLSPVDCPCNLQKAALQEKAAFVVLVEEQLPENLLPTQSTLQVLEALVQVSRQLDLQAVLVASIKLVLAAMAAMAALPRRLAQVTLVLQAQAMEQVVEVAARQKEPRPVLAEMALLAIVS